MSVEDRIRLPTLNLIHRRQRLLEQLAEFIADRKRLVTIYAPGGYGKSILLADFAQTTDLPVCWCSLDGGDQDPISFLTVLATSIADRFWGLNTDRLFEMLRRGDTGESVSHIADLLETVGPHIIILDDYHKAVSSATTLTLNRLLQRLPDTSHIIIAARGDMHLETGQVLELLISNRAAGLSEEDLRFTAPEIQRVILKRFGRHIDFATAEKIARVTGGNIAQILLTGHMLYTGEGLDSLNLSPEEERYFEYNRIAAEVLERQTPEVQRFLLWTSVLPDMTVELCNELLEISDAQLHIETVMRNGLFISQTGTGFTYHDLFAEFLRSRLRTDESVYRQVVYRAATILQGYGRVEDAINLYLKLNAWDDIVPVLEKHGPQIYDTGRALTLYYWLNQIPPQVLTPRLYLLQGRIFVNDLGDIERALSCFQKAEKRFTEAGDFIGAAEAQVWRSMNLWMMGRLRESLSLAKQGLEHLEALEAPEKVVAWAIRMRGLAYSVNGFTDEALKDLRLALQLFNRLNDTFNVAACHQDIGVCLEKRGNISAAQDHYHQALQYWETLGNANERVNTLNSLGVCAYLRGDYEKALEQFNECFTLAIKNDAIRRAAFVQAGIGDTYLALQNPDQALEAYTLSIQFARQTGIRSLEFYNRVRLGECFFQQSLYPQALTMARRVRDTAREAKLKFEQGLACILLGKTLVRQKQYEESVSAFEEALDCLDRQAILEATETRYWLAYSLFRSYRSLAAVEHLQEAVRLTLSMGEMVSRLQQTIIETQALLYHFLYKPDGDPQLQENLQEIINRFISQPAAGLQIFTFGGPMLVVEGKRRRFSQRGKARRLPEFLLYLLTEGRTTGCRWNEVSAVIWPDVDENKSSASFHQTLKRLRDSVLESSLYVSVENDYYQIKPEYLDWCDAVAFEALHEKATRVPPDKAVDLYREMINLYQGEFLAGFELEEWGNFQRHRYEIMFMRAVTLAARYLVEQKLPREALTVIDKGLAFDYFHEDLHQLALEAYAQLGLYDLLRDHYTDMSRIFQAEFGETPSSSTRELYTKLLARR